MTYRDRHAEHEARKAEGVCTRCGTRDARQSKTTCDVCAAFFAALRARRDDGLCSQCGERPAAPAGKRAPKGRVGRTCQQCRDERAAKDRARRRKRKAGTYVPPVLKVRSSTAAVERRAERGAGHGRANDPTFGYSGAFEWSDAARHVGMSRNDARRNVEAALRNAGWRSGFAVILLRRADANDAPRSTRVAVWFVPAAFRSASAMAEARDWRHRPADRDHWQPDTGRRCGDGTP